MNRNMNTMLSTTLKISMRFGSNDNDGVVDDDNIGLISNARPIVYRMYVSDMTIPILLYGN